MSADPTFSDVIASLRPTDTGFTAYLPEGWSQGRAGFGGLVTALGVEATRLSMRRAAADAAGARPALAEGVVAAGAETTGDQSLRAFTTAFVAPAIGALEIHVRRLRIGRAASFLQATLSVESGVAASVTVCYGPDRPSTVASEAPTSDDAPEPDDCPVIIPPPGITPVFLKHFELRRATPNLVFVGGTVPEVCWWVRHVDPAARLSEAGLVGILDVLPPAVAGILPRPAPMSSLTWMADFTSAARAGTRDGWWLLRSTMDYASAGFSGQRMEAWSSDGALIAQHRQSVGVFV